jgi:hypothetical protein
MDFHHVSRPNARLATSLANLLTNVLAIILIVIFISACTPAEFRQVASSVPTQTDIPGATPIPGTTPSPVMKTDTFTQDDSANKVDILIIDDNSYSMEVEQKKMAERFPSFISALGDLDYQIAVTTTDIDSVNSKTNLGGRVVDWTGATSKLLTPLTPKASDVFKNTIKRSETIGCANRGDCPSGNEQPLQATILAMRQRMTDNSGIFRDNVDLALIILSDEDEMSNGPSNATKPQDVVDAFKTEFGETKRLRAFGIVIKSGDEKCLKEQVAQTSGGNGGYYGTHVETLAAMTGGVVNSICDSDYSKSLAEISRSVRKLVGTFELSNAPKSVQVKLTPAPPIPILYKLEGKNLIFSTPPPAGTKIDVSYLVP